MSYWSELPRDIWDHCMCPLLSVQRQTRFLSTCKSLWYRRRIGADESCYLWAFRTIRPTLRLSTSPFQKTGDLLSWIGKKCDVVGARWREALLACADKGAIDKMDALIRLAREYEDKTTVKNFLGGDVALLAVHGERTNVVEMLLDRGHAKPRNVLRFAISLRKPRVIVSLLNRFPEMRQNPDFDMFRSVHSALEASDRGSPTTRAAGK